MIVLVFQFNKPFSIHKQNTLLHFFLFLITKKINHKTNKTFNTARSFIFYLYLEKKNQKPNLVGVICCISIQRSCAAVLPCELTGKSCTAVEHASVDGWYRQAVQHRSEQHFSFPT